MRESPGARRAWADYLALGEDRSLEKLLHRYQTGTEPAPTTNLTRLKLWSRTFAWQGRLQTLAEAAAAEAQAALVARRREVLESGLGLDHERVAALKRLAERLLGELEDDRLWLADAKMLGAGEHGERYDFERFNAAGVEQLRGLLEDIAAEKGERVRRHEHSGRDGAPIPVQIVMPDNGRGDRAPA